MEYRKKILFRFWNLIVFFISVIFFPIGCKKEISAPAPSVSTSIVNTVPEDTTFNFSCKDSTLPFVVIELFTSQDCAACPYSEADLSRLIAKEKPSGRNLIYIAEHVTYWDYLGWKDVYGMTKFNSRQTSSYNNALGNCMYTPQTIINGIFSSSNYKTVSEKINYYLGIGSTASAGITLKLNSPAAADTLKIAYKVAGTIKGKKLILAIVENGCSNSIRGGENSGRNLHEDAVARLFESYTISSQRQGIIQIIPPANIDRSQASVVAFIQDPHTMKILGATKGFTL